MAGRNSYIGKQVGNYRIVEKLACGSFGCVYRAEHVYLKRTVAIKIFVSARIDSPQEHKRFLEEAQFLNMLEHPHILFIYDVGLIDDEIPYMVIEYAPGKSLRDRLEKHPGQVLKIEEAIAILTQIGQALHYAHQQNVVHRDLKPENILFNAKGEALLADFGIAIVVERTKTIDVTGTPPYMAPEQFEGKISKKSDQYALACIAYELFTGQKPFTAPDFFAMGFKHLNDMPTQPTRLNSRLPLYMEQALLKAMAKKHEERFTDIEAFIEALHKSAKQWQEEGDELYIATRYKEAIVAYEQALQLDNHLPVVHNSKGNALWMLDRYEEALICYEQTVYFEPNNAIFHSNMGLVLHRLDRLEEALAAYIRACRLDPRNVTYMKNKDSVLHRLEEGIISKWSAKVIVPVLPQMSLVREAPCPHCAIVIPLTLQSCPNCHTWLSPSDSGLHFSHTLENQPTLVPLLPDLTKNGLGDTEKTIPYNIRQAGNGRLGLVVGTRTTPGIKRKHKPNEDSLFAAQGEVMFNASSQPFGLFVVADGMSGHANGQDASRLAIQTIINHMLPVLSKGKNLDREALKNLLVEGVQRANVRVYQRNKEQRADMGTTMTAGLVVGSTAIVANVGDSRAYLYREPEGLRKITNDHSVVASLVEKGIIKPDDIYTHPKLNQIYRNLGEKPVIEIDSFFVDLIPGDELLLCSHGLWQMVRDPYIFQVMRSEAHNPDQMADALIMAALNGGGEDNVSVIVVAITDNDQFTGITGINLLAKPETVQMPQL